MKKFLMLFTIFSLFSYDLVAGEYAKEANENPFLNGVLNAKYEGEVTALAGEVIEIKPTNKSFPVFKLNLRVEGVEPIWVTSIAPEPEGGIKVGDMLIFKGFISTAAGTDPSGQLEEIIGTKTLLMAIQSQRAE
jgi:hypothetical protein